jgi:hypothetical protein
MGVRRLREVPMGALNGFICREDQFQMTCKCAGCARTIRTLDKRQQWPPLICPVDELEVLELLVESYWRRRQTEASIVEPLQEIVNSDAPIPSRSADDTIGNTYSSIDKSGTTIIGLGNSIQW